MKDSVYQSLSNSLCEVKLRHLLFKYRLRRLTEMASLRLQYLLLTIGVCLFISSSAASSVNEETLSDFAKRAPSPAPLVHIIGRSGWDAQPPVKPPTPLKVKPAPYAIISHTASSFCYSQAQCTRSVRTIQTFHIESRGWNDIAYNFLVGGDGKVYEGRGWDVEGAHTYNYNKNSIGISLIGTFENLEPTELQIRALKGLLQLGVDDNRLSKDYKLIGHRQVVSTSSPGEKAYNIIKTWDHWSAQP